MLQPAARGDGTSCTGSCDRHAGSCEGARDGVKNTETNNIVAWDQLAWDQLHRELRRGRGGAATRHGRDMNAATGDARNYYAM